MDPHPDIAEDQGDGDEQESQCWVTSGGFDPGLIKLTVAGLNPEAQTIGLINPGGAGGTDPPTGIDQGLAPLPPTLSLPVAAVHADRHGGGVLIGIGQGIGIPATALGGGKDLGAAGTPWVIGGAPVANHRHDKRVACPVQIADNRHT